MRFKQVVPILAVVTILQAGAASTASAQTAATPQRGPDVIFVPTQPQVVEAMLTLAKVGPNDIVYDLGSGDGRIPIAAVQKFNAKAAVGIDIDPKRIEEANANLAKSGVGDRVKFLNQDLFTTPIGEATVVTLYLLESLNIKLMPKLQKELKPGSRVVSQTFSMGSGWTPDQTITVDGRSIYLWTIK
ncbi:MAG: cyclopropane-fatty-acyl-phospholipid synthase family protein [Vicinamibacterales bacterium]